MPAANTSVSQPRPLYGLYTSVLASTRLKFALKATIAMALFAVGLAFSPPVSADELLRFSVPATASGVRGDSTVTYHGYAQPKSRFNFTTNSVFTDPGLPNNVIMIAKSGDNSIDPVTRMEIPSTDTHDVLVGRSVDGGDTFYFRRVLKWTNGLRMVRVVMVPDPGRHLVWVGTGQVFQNVPDNPAESFRGTTRIEIDWATKRVRLLDQDLSGWDEYPLDTLNPPEPGYFTNKQFTHLAEVTVNNQTRFEAWATANQSPSTALPVPCRDVNIFNQNKAMWGSVGRRIAWYRFDPVNGVDLSSEKLITSSVRTLPTSYPRSDMQVTRVEFGNEEFLYVGTQEQIVCEELVQQNSDGGSVRFIKLQYNATTDNYDEVELDYVLDIASATSPNWTCVDPDVRCHGTTRNHYAKVNAIPYQDGGRLQLYVSAWGSEAPTLPAVGEVGTVSASHLATTVNLSRSYDDPVVFVQPPSFLGGQPAIARISNVTSSSFRVRLQEDTGLDGAHVVENLHYVVLERGTYRLSDKRVLEVDKVTSSVSMPSTISWTSKLDLQDTFDNDTGVVIFTQLQSMNDPDYAVTRHTGVPIIGNKFQCNPIGQCGNIRVGTTSFGIDREEASLRAGVPHGANEQIGVLALGEKWLGRSSSIFTLGPWGASGFDVRRVPGVGGITNSGWTSLAFEPPHLGNLSTPILLAWSETRNGGDPAHMRHRSLTSASVDLAIDEDVSFDAERNHALETVIYWVIGKGSGTIRAQPISSVVDQMF